MPDLQGYREGSEEFLTSESVRVSDYLAVPATTIDLRDGEGYYSKTNKTEITVVGCTYDGLTR